MLIPARGATDAQLSAAVERVAAAAGPVAGVSLPDAARERAVAQARAGGVLVVPLRAEVGEDEATEVAVDLRERLAVGAGRARASAPISWGRARCGRPCRS